MYRIILISLFLLAAQNLKAQTKKVLFEEFTGTWCGYCPSGSIVLEQLHAANSFQLIPVAFHNQDPLEVPDGLIIDDSFDVLGYPNAMIDRILYPGEIEIPLTRSLWPANFNIRKNEPAIVSVSIQNAMKNGPFSYSAQVNTQFTSLPKPGLPIKVNVFLTEDSIPAIGPLAQSNYSSSIEGGADPLANWYHNATFRKALGGAWGYSTTIPSIPLIGTTYSENINFTIPANWVEKNINVIAYVAYDGADKMNNEKEILNSEQYPLKYWYPNSVKEIEESLEISIFPNPARINTHFKTSFTLDHDAIVEFKIYNSIGQTIIQPYKSFEIAGSHTIQWLLTEENFKSNGLYFVELSTSTGLKRTNKLFIH